MLPKHPRLHLRPAHAQFHRKLGAQAKRVRPPARAQDVMPPQSLCKDLHAQLHRVRLHDDCRRQARPGGKRIGIFDENLVVGLPKGCTVHRRVGVGGDRDACQHHHHIGIHCLWIDHQLDRGCTVPKRVFEIGQQAPQLILTATPTMAHQLQTGRLRQDVPVQQLNGKLASAAAGCTDHCYVHIV